ncbi:MAG: gamma-glutamyl-gamma-aminobutyrate hydrolase family protein [Actinomycetota bacterium]
MSVLVIQHLDPEGPHSIAHALRAASVRWMLHRADWESGPLPRARDLAGLVVMGGPASAYSDENFPTRAAELSLIAECLRAEVPILGVCLGAQLLAAAAGARRDPRALRCAVLDGRLSPRTRAPYDRGAGPNKGRGHGRRRSPKEEG